jgi:hypothetical protein
MQQAARGTSWRKRGAFGVTAASVWFKTLI